MDPETARLMRCLQQIHKVIGKGSEIFASTSQPSVCKEVLLSAPGTAYILGLSEVYRVSRRLEEGMKARKLASELLQHTLREVDMAWNNVLSFLVLGQSVFPLLRRAGSALSFVLLTLPQTLQGWEPSAGSAGCPSVPGPAPSQACGVCLTEVKQQPEAHAGNSDPVMHQGSYYHAGCANFWLNCVDSILPRET
ncbi:synergin gamma-like [Varanus komodoensis]|uniref:synergin gamma-like n=1 Tax=Varanus komodoensis TaxID=61221 RepID=UPI001CF79F77|nr:synergin gamma-like [Varanus komodoensis]